MSASPHKPNPELIDQTTPEIDAQVALESSTPARSSSTAPASSAPAGHEALQALLAFSSLHEQIRQRRAHESRWGNAPGTDVWELEQFVLDEVLQLVAERALTITGSDGIAIALAEDDAIVCRASTGVIAPDRGARLDPNSGFSGACLRSGRIVRSDDTEDDPRVNVETCRRLGVRSLVAVPIAGTQGVMGLLEAFSSETYGFNDSDVRSLSLLAELILAAMKPEEEDRLAQISQRVVMGAPAATAVTRPAQQDHREEQVSPAQTRASEVEDVAEEVPALDFPQAASAENSRPGLRVVLVLVLLATILGVGLWWKLHHPKQVPVNASPAISTAAQPSSGQPAAASDAAQKSDAVITQESVPDADANVAEAQDASGLPRVTGIQHVSSPGSSVVTVELQDQVQYEAHRLSNPERIYVDLHGTALAPGLFGKTIEVGDELLTRVRIAQPKRAVTRVVLETKGSSDFSVSFESSPSRLVIEVKPAGKAQPKTNPEPLKSAAPLQLAPLPLAPPAPAPTTHVATKEQPRKEESAKVHVPKFRIVLDAGHGGWDLGTVGRKGLLEKDLVVDIVDRLGKLVDKGLGAEIIYTRPDDNYVALEKRAEIANLSHADLFVSVHANYSSDPSARGVETYYTNTYSSVRARTHDSEEAETALDDVNWTNVDIREKVRESRRFASTVQHALYQTLASQNPEIRNRGVRQAAYVVLTGTTMPAILAEVSFVSNAADESKLRDSAYRQQIAEALYEGIAHYAATFHPATVTSAAVNPGGK